MHFFLYLKVLVVLHLLLEGASAEGREENDEVKILDFTSSLIDSLTKSTEFFHDNYDKQNVDALYCLRVVQGKALSYLGVWGCLLIWGYCGIILLGRSKYIPAFKENESNNLTAKIDQNKRK